MTLFLSTISIFFIPFIISTIIIHGLRRRVPVYDLFAEGAKDGMKTCIEILPFLIAIFIAIEALTSSGAMEWLENLLEPFLSLFGIPKELTAGRQSALGESERPAAVVGVLGVVVEPQFQQNSGGPDPSDFPQGGGSLGSHQVRQGIDGL